MKVIREINRGGFGRVEEVELADGTRAARKVFCPAFQINSLKERDKLIKRFVREVRVQSSLNCKGIMPIFSKHLEGTEPYYVMPLAEKNFCEEIKSSKVNGIAPKKALADILSALEELHELGYVHRDLKPQNVLLYEGVWRLSDFGLVLPPDGETTKLTSTDSGWGSPGYCAPEQAIEFHHAKPLADIYSLGCILHDIYSTDGLRIPYQRYSASGDIGLIIEKCTEFEPSKRFQGIRSLRGALLTLLNASPNIAVSADAAEWLSEVKRASTWDEEKIGKFLRFLIHSTDTSDQYEIFKLVDENDICHFYATDSDLFKTFANLYCDWVSETSFPFDFCDVLINRLQQIFDLGDLETKAAVAIAGAKLARGHHRWWERVTFSREK